MPGALAEKVAIVTGGGSGIGRSAALLLAREGAKVMVADVDERAGEEAAEMIRSRGGESDFVRADVSREPDVEAMVARTVETFGRLDCAFNNAGILEEGSPNVTDYPLDLWNRVIGVNLTGVWLCIKHEIPEMLKQGGGAIVNNASVASLVGLPGATALVASKHGVIGLTKNAALEYAEHGIRVNAVCPSFIKTPILEPYFAAHPEEEIEMISKEPVGRLGAPEEVAEAAVWLLSDAASFVTGHSMVVDGGYTAR